MDICTYAYAVIHCYHSFLKLLYYFVHTAHVSSLFDCKGGHGTPLQLALIITPIEGLIFAPLPGTASAEVSTQIVAIVFGHHDHCVQPQSSCIHSTLYSGQRDRYNKLGPLTAVIGCWHYRLHKACLLDLDYCMVKCYLPPHTLLHTVVPPKC